MNKKIFVLILAILCLTAVPALAAGSLNLEDIESGSGEIGGGTYSYDAATKTLTLNSVNLTGGSNLLFENYEVDRLDTIVFNGENSINATYQYAFKTYGDLTITGEGSLTVNAPFAPITVDDGDLIIDGVDVSAYSTGSGSALYVQGVLIDASDHSRDGKIEIRNGGSLTAESNGRDAAVLCGSRGSILVTDGSRLAIDSRNTYSDSLYLGTLTVSDTSSVELRSGYGGLSAQTVEAAEAAVLTADDPQNHKYGLSFNKGSEPYIFTVNQTAMDDGRNLVTITGAQNSNAGGEAEVIPMPETGDESHLILWTAMLLTAMVYFIKRRKANA